MKRNLNKNKMQLQEIRLSNKYENDNNNDPGIVIVKIEAGISFFLISQDAKLWLVITVI